MGWSTLAAVGDSLKRFGCTPSRKEKRFETYRALLDAKKAGKLCSYNKLVLQVLVRWSLQHGFNPLPKPAHEERIVSNVGVFDLEIAPQDWVKLDALHQGTEGALGWNPVHAP
ncbi:hypothetical protein C8Q79DRAFT_1014053 [Trametes meyenii]|nr:hypothetical protein C8Q79DRAFT_1014053 [Trametes meyenii]